jgi:hypothetical protein
MDDLQRELADVERRTRRYWFDDGLAEIFASAVFLVVALYFLAQRALGPHTSNALQNLAFPILIVVLAIARRGLRMAKSRLVYPRTGYVAFRRPQGHRWATGALACVISVLIALLITRAPMLLNWISATEGLVFGVALLSLGRKTGMLRFPVEGLLTALVGFALSIMRLEENVAAALLFASVGAVLVAGGLVGLVSYLRTAPGEEGP